jgi:hypothetical protein
MHFVHIGKPPSLISLVHVHVSTCMYMQITPVDTAMPARSRPNGNKTFQSIGINLSHRKTVILTDIGLSMIYILWTIDSMQKFGCYSRQKGNFGVKSTASWKCGLFSERSHLNAMLGDSALDWPRAGVLEMTSSGGNSNILLFPGNQLILLQCEMH